jgi:type IV fimbrial biogenesis protein FimT
VQQFNINTPGADRPLQVDLGLGGQVHMCDPNVVLSNAHPEGC